MQQHARLHLDNLHQQLEESGHLSSIHCLGAAATAGPNTVVAAAAAAAQQPLGAQQVQHRGRQLQRGVALHGADAAAQQERQPAPRRRPPPRPRVKQFAGQAARVRQRQQQQQHVQRLQLHRQQRPPQLQLLSQAAAAVGSQLVGGQRKGAGQGWQQLPQSLGVCRAA